MSGSDDRYAVVLQPDNQTLARWLRPFEAAAFVETYNRLLCDAARHAQMIRERPNAAPASSPTDETSQ